MASKMPYFMFQDLERGRSGLPEELIAPLLAAELDKINQFQPKMDWITPYQQFRQAPIENRLNTDKGPMDELQALRTSRYSDQGGPITPIDLDQFLANKLSMELGAGDIPLPEGSVLTSYERDVGSPDPTQPPIRTPFRPLRDMITAQNGMGPNGEPPMYLDNPEVHKPYAFPTAADALRAEGMRRVSAGETEAPPPMPRRPSLEEIIKAGPSGGPPPLDPTLFPGMEDFLMPGNTVNQENVHNAEEISNDYADEE